MNLNHVNPNGTLNPLALHEAVHQGDLKAVVALLAAGANPNHPANELQGCAPLHIACLLHGRAFQGSRHREASVYSDIAATLIFFGAQVSLRDQQYRLPAGLAEGFPPKCVREAMAKKAAAMPGVFDPDDKGMGFEHFHSMMRDHRLSSVEPIGGGPRYLSDLTPPSELRVYFAERKRLAAHYKKQLPVNAARAHEEELAAGRAALARLGLGQAQEVRA